MDSPIDWQIVELSDERDAQAEHALQLIVDSFAPPHRQPIEQLRMEVAEKRLGLLNMTDFHLLAAAKRDGGILGVVSGVYLSGINAGLVTYLVVQRAGRGHGLGSELRAALVSHFRADAKRAGHEDLAYVVGEVESESPWLTRLLRDGALPFRFDYYHPGMEPGSDQRYTLYRQPVGDTRDPLPRSTIRQIIYAIYRRGYRVRYPLGRRGFRAMLEALDD